MSSAMQTIGQQQRSLYAHVSLPAQDASLDILPLYCRLHDWKFLSGYAVERPTRGTTSALYIIHHVSLPAKMCSRHALTHCIGMLLDASENATPTFDANLLNISTTLAQICVIGFTNLLEVRCFTFASSEARLTVTAFNIPSL